MPSRVLVVDDDTSLLTLLRLVLTHAGFEVETAASGQEALERVQARVPDVATIDLMMPEMDGITLTRLLRAAPPTRHMPIIMLTARVDETGRVAALAAGADDFVAKPISHSELTARIQAALRGATEHTPTDPE